MKIGMIKNILRESKKLKNSVWIKCKNCGKSIDKRKLKYRYCGIKIRGE